MYVIKILKAILPVADKLKHDMARLCSVSLDQTKPLMSITAASEGYVFVGMSTFANEVCAAQLLFL